MTIELIGKWRGALLAAVAPALLAGFAAGCDKKTQDAAPDPSAAAASASADPAAAGTEVAPPPAVVSGDPDIPLNEAVVGATPVPADYAADTAPPAAVVEEQPPTPDPADVWVPGYWWWSTGTHHYVWVSGAWRNPPPEQVWTPGQWVAASPERYLWVPGFWGARGAPPPPAISSAPPPPRVEVYGPAPGVGYSWTPGYYAWRDNSYFWTEGSWVRPPREGLGWVDSRYVAIGGHYYFQPGRWDFPADHRGVVYRPDPNARPGAHIKMEPVPQSLVTAHVKYVAASSHAIALGGTRQANGGYTVRPGETFHPIPRGNEPQGGAAPHGNEPQGGAQPPHAGGEPPHGGGEPPHAGGEPPHAGGEPPHGGGEPPHTGNEPPRKEPVLDRNPVRGLPTPEKKPGQK